MHTALKLTQELISARSITPDDCGCQDLMIERLSAIGFNIERMPFADSHGSVSNFWARRGAKQPLIVFAGHPDVVPTGDENSWNTPPFEPQIIDDKLYGRGAADMKSSLAAFVVAAEQFVATTPNYQGSIGFLITSDEEGPATCGTVKVIETLEARGEKIDYCLVGEPSSTDRIGDVIKNGRRGSIGCQLKINGTQGHIAYPHLADNPIPIAAHVISTLSEIKWDTGNEYFQPTSLQFSNINSGTGATNVIPGNAHIVFNLRFSTEITSEEIITRIEQELDGMKVDYEIEWRVFGQPFLTPKGTLVGACASAIESSCGYTPKLSTSGGTSDGRFIAPTGAQVVELGPINASIHMINEYVPANSPELLTEIYTKVLENILLPGAS